MTPMPTSTPLLSAYRVHELPAEHFARLREAPGPLHGLPPPPADHARVLVVEDAEARLLGYWVLSDVVHADPLWLDPAVRGNPGVALRLLAQLGATLQACGVGAFFAVIDDAEVADLAERLGFTRLPGALYAIAVPPLGQEERS